MQKGYTEWIICRFHSNNIMKMEYWSGNNPNYDELEKEDNDIEKHIHIVGSPYIFNLHPKSKEIKTR